jgi:short-chain fatty acids transporter
VSPEPRASWLARFAARTCAWSERWFPEAYLFAVLALALVALAAWVHGASAGAVAVGFGEGFWSLIPFTMQMSFVIIGGFVTASSPPIRRLTQWLAGLPGSGRSAVACVALCSMLLALLHWGLSLILASLLVRALARRSQLRMDYRAAGAAR